jgi:hypothetical protein
MEHVTKNTVAASWYDDQQSILLYTFEDNWTWNDLKAVQEVVMEMIEGVPHRVDVIADVTKQTQIPKQMFNNWGNMAMGSPSNQQLTVAVVSNNAVRLWVQAAKNMIPVVRRDYRVTETVAEAVRLIKEDRAKALPDKG